MWRELAKSRAVVGLLKIMGAIGTLAMKQKVERMKSELIAFSIARFE